MRVGVSALLVTLLASAWADQSGAGDVMATAAANGTPASASASGDAEWKIEDSILPECALQCKSYLELYHECYDANPASNCALWCDSKNYNAVVLCYNCGLNVDKLVQRYASDCVTLVGSLLTETIQVLYPGSTQAAGRTDSGPIDFLNQTTTHKPLPSSSSGNPLTPVVNAPSSVSARPSATQSSGAGVHLATPRVALLAVIAVGAMAL